MKCIKCTTLGAKNKEFEWTYSTSDGITIFRDFKNGSNKVVFTNDDIEKMLKYIEFKKEVELANSVTKLLYGTEKDGIGKFIYENIDKNTTTAQAASQLVAIFYKAGILGYNQKPRGMKFWLECNEWEKQLLKV